MYQSSKYLGGRSRRSKSYIVSSHLPGVLHEILLQKNKNKVSKRKKCGADGICCSFRMTLIVIK